MLIYFAIWVPFELAFIGIQYDNDPSHKDPLWKNVFNYSLDCIFMIDIIMNFFTAYELPNKKMEKNLRNIAVTYLSTWFFIDLTATFPIQIFFSASVTNGSKKNANKLARLARLPRLYKIAKILRVMRMIKLIRFNRKLQRYLGKYRNE